MTFVKRIFKRSDHTAKVAHERLYEVLARERTLPLPIAKPVSVTIKETFDGLIIVFGEGDWPDQLDNLAMQLDSPAMRDFFEGARIRIETGNRPLGPAELEDLSLLLAQHNMILNPRRADGNAGLLIRRTIPLVPPEAVHSEIAYTRPPDVLPEPGDWAVADTAGRDPVLLIRHSIVAGQVIHYGGTIVIFGDVSPAAEVIADSDVIVFGRLRGVVHAGASGNENSFIAALILAATQVRIGTQIAHVARGNLAHSWPAEIARVDDGHIVVEPWGNPQAQNAAPVP
jgi:septum site-determining protein MinC